MHNTTLQKQPNDNDNNNNNEDNNEDNNDENNDDDNTQHIQPNNVTPRQNLYSDFYGIQYPDCINMTNTGMDSPIFKITNNGNAILSVNNDNKCQHTQCHQETKRIKPRSQIIENQQQHAYKGQQSRQYQQQYQYQQQQQQIIYQEHLPRTQRYVIQYQQQYLSKQQYQYQYKLREESLPSSEQYEQHKNTTSTFSANTNTSNSCKHMYSTFDRKYQCDNTIREQDDEYSSINSKHQTKQEYQIVHNPYGREGITNGKNTQNKNNKNKKQRKLTKNNKKQKNNYTQKKSNKNKQHIVTLKFNNKKQYSVGLRDINHQWFKMLNSIHNQVQSKNKQ